MSSLQKYVELWMSLSLGGWGDLAVVSPTILTPAVGRGINATPWRGRNGEIKRSPTGTVCLSISLSVSLFFLRPPPLLPCLLFVSFLLFLSLELNLPNVNQLCPIWPWMHLMSLHHIHPLVSFHSSSLLLSVYSKPPHPTLYAMMVQPAAWLCNIGLMQIRAVSRDIEHIPAPSAASAHFILSCLLSLFLFLSHFLVFSSTQSLSLSQIQHKL